MSLSAQPQFYTQQQYAQNLFDNSELNWWQRRGSSATSTLSCPISTRTFACDRFAVNPSGAAVTIQQSTTTPTGIQSAYSLQINGATSNTGVFISQRIESLVIAAQGKQALCLSYWIYNNSGSSFTSSLILKTPSTADTWTTNTQVLSLTFPQTVASNGWTQISTVIQPSIYSNYANGLDVSLSLPALTSGNVNVCAPQLVAGVVPLPFFNDYAGVSFNRCLRWYEKSFNDSQLPAINISSSLLGAVSSNNNSGNYGYSLGVSSTFQHPKIKVPVVTFYPTYGTAINQVTGYNTGPIYATNYITIIGSKSFYIQWNGQMSVTLQFNYTADAEDYTV